MSRHDGPQGDATGAYRTGRVRYLLAVRRGRHARAVRAWRRPWLRAVAALMTGVVVASGLSAGAVAAILPSMPILTPGRTLVNFYSQGTHRDAWAGAYVGSKVAGSAKTGVAFCIDSSRVAGTGSGTTSSISDSTMAYALWRYEDSATSLNRAALAYLAKDRLDDGGKDNGASLRRWRSAVAAQHPDVLDRVATIKAQAGLYRGPYTSDIGLTMDNTTMKGTVTKIGVRSTAGNLVDGIAYTAKITAGDAKFSNGTKTITGTTSSSEYKTRGVAASTAGTVKVTVTYDSLAATKLVAYNPNDDPNVQQYVVQAAPVDLSDSATDAVSPQVKVATKANKKATASGTALTDTITLTDGPANVTLKGVSVRLWRNSTNPADVVTRGSGRNADISARTPAPVRLSTTAHDIKLDKNGEAVFTPPAHVTSQPGTYVYVVVVPAQFGMKQVIHDYGVPAEIVRVDRPSYTPEVVTSAAYTRTASGADVTDTIVVSDLPAHAPVSITARLYRHSTVPGAAITQSATVPWGAVDVTGAVNLSGTTNAAGTATFTTPARPSGGFGVFTWVVSVAAATTSTYTIEAYTSPYGVASETLRIYPPAITTTASAATGEWTGVDEYTATFVDEVRIARAAPWSSGTLTGRLYWSETSPDEQDTVPAGARLVGTTTTTMTTGADGTAAVPLSLKVKNPDLGFYTWVVSAPAGVLGFATAYTSAYGIDEETVEYTPPPPFPALFSVTTRTSDALAVKGGKLHDVLDVKDPQNVLLTHPTTVTSTLWGPFAARPTLGSVIDPAAAPRVGMVETNVDSMEIYETPELELPADGFYVWTYSYPQSQVRSLYEGYDAHEDLTVYAEEMTLVPWAPKVVTEVSTQVAEAGSRISDRLEISGGQPGASAEVVSTLYGPLMSVPTRSETLPDDLPAVGSVVTDVTFDAAGEAEATTEEIEVPESGIYVFHETIAAATDTFAGEPTSVAWSAPFGVASETTLVPWMPQVTTKTSAPLAAAGRVIFDELEVTGLRPGTEVKVVSTLWKVTEGQVPAEPVEMTDELVAALGKPFAEVVTSLTADEWGKASGRTAEVTTDPSDAAVYVWTEQVAPSTDAWAGTALQSGWQGRFGEPSEITRTVRVSTQAQGAVVHGTPLVDVALVEGPVPAGSRLGWRLYRQDAGDDAALDELVATTAQITIDAAGEYTSGLVDGVPPGRYYWREELYLPGEDEPFHLGAPRLPNETVDVVRVVTQALPAAEAGSPVHDVAFVEGTVPDGATLVFDLYRQDGGTDVALDALVATTDAIAITAAGSYKSPTVEGQPPGTYYWRERLHVPANPEPVHVGAPRLPAETTTVVPPSDGGDEPPSDGGDEPPSDGGDEPKKLPRTGAETITLLVTAAMLLAGGVAAVTAANRRRS